MLRLYAMLGGVIGHKDAKTELGRLNQTLTIDQFLA